MATGPEHYSEAEHLLDVAHHIARPDSGHSDAEATMLVGLALNRAQVHATLALAAATALVDYHDNGMTEGDQLAWYRAASAQPEHYRRKRAAEAADLDESAKEPQL